MSKYKFKYITGDTHVVRKWNHADMEGEYSGGGEFKFKLKTPLFIPDVTGRVATYTHALLNIGDWHGGLHFVGHGKKRVEITPVPTKLQRDMYEALVIAESGNGQLKDWCFSDELYGAAFPETIRRF